jgi:hypothetical protein
MLKFLWPIPPFPQISKNRSKLHLVVILLTTIRDYSINGGNWITSLSSPCSMKYEPVLAGYGAATLVYRPLPVLVWKRPDWYDDLRQYQPCTSTCLVGTGGTWGNVSLILSTCLVGTRDNTSFISGLYQSQY